MLEPDPAAYFEALSSAARSGEQDVFDCVLQGLKRFLRIEVSVCGSSHLVAMPYYAAVRLLLHDYHTEVATTRTVRATLRNR